jgi:hypothetical protein
MKTVWIVLLATLLAEAGNPYELKLYEKVLPMLFTQYPIRVYADETVRNTLLKSRKFVVVDRCDDSVAVLIGKSFPELPDICQDKPLFSTSYRTYKNMEESFGAFYWRKGRPQLRFKKERLEHFHLMLPETLQRYLEE